MLTLYSPLPLLFFHYWCIWLKVLKRKRARRKVLYREVAPKSFEAWPPKTLSTEVSFSRLLTILNLSQTAIKVTRGFMIHANASIVLLVCWVEFKTLGLLCCLREVFELSQVSRPPMSSSDWDLTFTWHSTDIHLNLTWPPDHHLTFPWPLQDPNLT